MNETKQRLLETAGPIFAEKGFAHATVREICDAAGVNLASVNYHFGDKEGLYVETLQFARNWLNERSPVVTLDQTLGPEQRLRNLVRGLLERLLGKSAETWHMKLVNREILNPTVACQQLIRQHFHRRVREIMALIDEIGGPSLPEHELEQLAFSVTGQCFHYHMAGKFIGLLTKESGTQEYYRIDLLAEQIARFTLAGVTHWKSYSYPHDTAAIPAPHISQAPQSVDPALMAATATAVFPWSNEMEGSSQSDA